MVVTPPATAAFVAVSKPYTIEGMSNNRWDTQREIYHLPPTQLFQVH